MLSSPDQSPAGGQASAEQSSSVAPESHPSSRPRTGLSASILASLLLVMVTVGLYSPVRHHPFVNYDDGVYVTHNDHVKSGLHRDSVKWALTSYDAANWHPVTWLSHIVDYQLFRDNAGAHHDVNLLLHVVNVLLLFWVLQLATGYTGRSAMVAALFALHPINVESVAWIAERKNLLSMMFFLLTLAAYGRYARKPRLPLYLLVAALFALGLMSKPQVVTLPFVLLLWDYWPLERTSSPPLFPGTGVGARKFLAFIEEKLPLFGLSAASVILTMKAQRSGGGFNPDYTLFQRLENASVSYVRYIGKAFWPSHLALMYPHPGSLLETWEAALSLVLLGVISILVVRARDRRYLLVGWLWFLGTLVPMIGVIQVGRQAMADRYAYLPFIGLFIMVCWGIADFANQRHLSPAWLTLPACALLALSCVTYRQIGYWADDVSLWTHTIEVTGGNYSAESELGDALMGLGRVDDAQKHFLRAVAINPSYPPALMSLAVQQQREGNLPEAITRYQKVILATANPAHQNKVVRATAFANLGHAYRELGELTQARDALNASVELKSDRFEPWFDLGIVSQQLGDVTTAIHAYYRAVTIHPSDVGYLLLAQALTADGHPVEAKWAEQRAKELTSDYPRAQETAARLIAH